jgi:hypothetical protein
VVDSFFAEFRSIISLIIESYNGAHFKLLKDGHIVVGSKCAILHYSYITLYLSTGFSEGELKAMNLLGMIQFRSPFSIFS